MTRGRTQAVAAIVLLLGLLFVGAAWALYSDRDSENERTLDRVATIDAAATPAFPVGIVPPTVAPDDTPIDDEDSESGEPPLLMVLPPTVVPEPTRTPVPPLVPQTPTSSPTPAGDMPHATHIFIPLLGVNTDITEVSSYPVEMADVVVLKWNVADWTAGHHDTSADPGEGGNIVLSGHDDYKGEVFKGLHGAEIGDDIYLTSPAGVFRYRIVEVHLRKEKGAPLSERLNIGLFLQPMPEDRLTLITCWPYGIDDHRMIIVAKPATGNDDRYQP